MPDTLNESIQDIAVKHGVVLGKDDPILMLHTMNERLVEDTRIAQHEMLAQFKAEMEQISAQWKDDTREKAEKVLNAALASSKEAMARLMRESANETVDSISKIVSESLAEARDITVRAKRFSWCLFGVSVALLGGLFLINSLFGLGILH